MYNINKAQVRACLEALKWCSNSCLALEMPVLGEVHISSTALPDFFFTFIQHVNTLTTACLRERETTKAKAEEHTDTFDIIVITD